MPNKFLENQIEQLEMAGATEPLETVLRDPVVAIAAAARILCHYDYDGLGEALKEASEIADSFIAVPDVGVDEEHRYRRRLLQMRNMLDAAEKFKGTIESFNVDKALQEYDSRSEA